MAKHFFDNDTRVFAHRGVPIEFPENTLLSFKRAVELGVDVIETDIHFTKDKGFIVIHDESLERLTEGVGNVRDYSIKELKQFDAGFRFTKDNGKTYPFKGKNIKLLSLEEMLNEFPNQRFNIDLKEKNQEQIGYYADIIKRHNAQNRVLTASEHSVNLKGIRKLFPDMATSFSLWEALGFYTLYKTGFMFLTSHFNGDALQIPEHFGPIRIVTKSFVKHAHNKGIQVHVWTINNRDDIIRLFNLGVDGIISDDPILLKQIANDN
ncbi:MAG: glycerophosphodiester phosphodiesterase [Spirochaetota bacterium]|nr:glycerophosphodiester phosphodiesterase [Spirochaetota bacterium]